MAHQVAELARAMGADAREDRDHPLLPQVGAEVMIVVIVGGHAHRRIERADAAAAGDARRRVLAAFGEQVRRSEEHTSELQSLMRISYAVFCLTKKKTNFNST